MKGQHIPRLALEITKAEWHAAAGTANAFCQVEGSLNRRTGVDGVEYAIGFALALPQNWNHDFLMQGGGGLNGTVIPPKGAQAAGNMPALDRGFAVVSTDTGHKGKVFDGSFMNDQQADLDFDYVAIGKVAELAKQLVFQYYGSAADHSYFSGCSTGGREAMIMTQRYPLYFDGVVSGAPAMRTGFSNLADRTAAVAYNSIAQKDATGKVIPGTAISPQEEDMVVDALLKHCDAKDGIADGMIFNFKGCDFNPAELQCSGAKSDSCLAKPQVEAIQHAFAGPKDSRGFHVYPGFLYDTGINARNGLPGLLAPGPSPVGPASPMTQNIDVEEELARQPLVDSTSTKLSTFAGHGGKLLFYHGGSDPWFSALDTLDYYTRMTAANGGPDSVMKWSRYYLVPGMGHCGGGQRTLDKFDMLTAIVNWVEKGIAPDSVVATGSAFPGRSRPLCAYPKHAVYSGQGNTEDASNFICRD
jgi:feruloyl esterase